MSAHERLAPPAAGGNGGDRTPEQAFRVPSAVPPSQQQTLADLTANWLKAQATLQMAHEAAQNGKSNGNLGAWPSNPWMLSMQQPDQKFSPEPASKLLKPNGSLPHHLTSTPVSSRGNSSSPIFRPIPSRGASLTPHPLPPTPGGLYSPIPTLITNNTTTPTVKTESSRYGGLSVNDNDSAFGEDDSTCSRTTPVNHKSLKKWRQKSQPGGGKKRAPTTDPFAPISVRTGGGAGSPALVPPPAGPLSAPSTFNWGQLSSRSASRCSESTGSSHSSGFYGASGLASPPCASADSGFALFNTTYGYSSMSHNSTTKVEEAPPPPSDVTKSKIPVGIAVGRQRAAAATSTGSAASSEPNKSSCEKVPVAKSEIKSVSREVIAAPAQQPLFNPAAWQPQPPPPPTQFAPPPPPPYMPAPPPAPPSQQHSTESIVMQSAAVAMAPFGAPGYQLTKDPLTGQLFVLPPAVPPTAAYTAVTAAYTQHTQQQQQHVAAGIWANPAFTAMQHAAAVAAAAAAVAAPMTATSALTAAAHQSQLIQQWQQHMASSPAGPWMEASRLFASQQMTSAAPAAAAVATASPSIVDVTEEEEEKSKFVTPPPIIKPAPVKLRVKSEEDLSVDDVTDSPSKAEEEEEKKVVEEEEDQAPVSPPRTKEVTVTVVTADDVDLDVVKASEDTEDEQVSVGSAGDCAKRESTTSKSGLDLLTEGIEHLQKQEQQSIKPPVSPLEILCDAAGTLAAESGSRGGGTANKLAGQVRSRSLDTKGAQVLAINALQNRRNSLSITSDFGRSYKSPQAEREAKAFIASRSKSPMRSPVHKDQNGTSEREKKMRHDLAEIQKKFQAKYKELYKHECKKQHSPLKRKSTEATTAAGMLSPKKMFSSKPLPLHPDLLEAMGDQQQQQQQPRSGEQAVELVPDLSTITSRFKSSRPNPFENLLRLQKQDKKATNVDPIVVKKTPNSLPVVKSEEEQRFDLEQGVSPINDAPSSDCGSVGNKPIKKEKDEPKVTPFKLKIPPKSAEVASGSEMESVELVKKKKKSKKSKKRKNKDDELERKTNHIKTESNEDHQDVVDPGTCMIKESDLCQGLRVLCKIDSHFHPAHVEVLSPPDIYGVRVIKDRANHQHIFIRDELLKDAIFEVAPRSVDDLPIGTRVVAYWSEKYSYLFPGTIGERVEDPKTKDQCLVIVELDDGDDRAIHYSQIRFLPPGYPIVESGQEVITCYGRRGRNLRRTQSFGLDDSFSATESPGSSRRGSAVKTSPRPSVDSATSAAASDPRSVACNLEDRLSAASVKPSQRGLSTSNGCVKSGSVKREPATSEGGSPTKKIKIVVKKELKPKPIRTVKNDTSDDDDEQTVGMAAFLPHQNLWKWSSKGHKRIKTRCLHREIRRGGRRGGRGSGGERLSVGDCAVFLSTGRPDRPYVGRLESLWETSSGQMRVKVRWFYHATETEGTAQGGRRVQDLKLPGALFESCHYDENDVQTISHKCEVVQFADFRAKIGTDPSKLDSIYENNDFYYLAGRHDPVEGTIDFEDEVLNDHHHPQ